MLVTVRFPLLLISIPVRFALHLSLWSMSNLRSCLHVFVLLLLLLSACAGSWLSVQVVLVAAVLLLRSLLAAPAAALRGCSFGGSCAAPAALAAPVGALSGYFSGGHFFWLPLQCSSPFGALVGCVNWGTFLPASEDAPTMAAPWAAAFT